MGQGAKAWEAAKQNPRGLRFTELQRLVVAAGFELKRVKGSHHMYSRKGVQEIIDIQPNGKDAKAYQVRQVLEIIDRYQISIE